MNRTILFFFFGCKFIYYKSIIKSSIAAEDTVYEAVTTLGGVYIKLAQFLSLRLEHLSERSKLRFLSVYDNAPIETISIVAKMTNELGKEKLSQFKHIVAKPFASGAFGQVYMAQLKTGRNVIIKVQKSKLQRNLFWDFLLLKFFARLFSIFYQQRVVDFNELVKEFEVQTYNELNYQQEVKNALYFYNYYKNHPTIIVPQTYSDLSTSTVLVQDYVEGIPLTTLLRKKLGIINKEVDNWLISSYVNIPAILADLMFQISVQGLKHEFFYADPHPGNILLLGGNRYALIDFGITGVSPKQRRLYYKIFKDIVVEADKLDMESVGKSFLEWGASRFIEYLSILDGFSQNNSAPLWDTVVKNYKHLLSEKREYFRSIEIKQKEDFFKVFLTVIQVGERFRITLPSGMTSILRTTGLCKSMTQILEPDLHPMRSVYQNVLAYVDETTLINENELDKKPVSYEEAFEKVCDWLGSIAEQDILLYTQLSRQIQHHYV